MKNKKETGYNNIFTYLSNISDIDPTLIENKEIYNYDDIVKLGIAHVPEHRRLFPRMSVEDNLRMGSYAPQFRANYNKRLEFVYSLFPRMQERRNQLAGTMSGGEQQMCAIGRALMSDPKILLMDEPSAGLAPVIVQQVFDLINKIKSEGLTVLIVEQNVKQVTCLIMLVETLFFKWQHLFACLKEKRSIS